MKKLLLITLSIGAGIYLNRSYAHFYDSLGQNILTPPTHIAETTIGNLNGETLKYAALGDSLTAGVGAAKYESSYPYLAALKIPAKKIELLNFALAGSTSKDMLIYQVPRAISSKPNIITLLIGINDIHNLKSPKEFADNLTQSVKTLKKTNAAIYLLSIPYLGSDKIVYFPYNLILDFQTKQFNNIIRKISTDYSVKYIDLYSAVKSADFYSSDQFHPGEQGYAQWAKIINVN